MKQAKPVPLMLRLPADLHKEAKLIAEITGLSINTLIVLALRGLVERRASNLRKGDHGAITKK